MNLTFLDKVFNYQGTKVKIDFQRYALNKSIRLSMYSTELEPWLTITCCMDIPEGSNFDINKNVLIKTWSENEGVDEWLYKNGIAKPTGMCIRSDFMHWSTEAPVFELIMKPKGFQDANVPI